ncbi:unnamed protein product [Cuscuta epithymum]|uniref:G3BP-like protein n=1 Tax=Cuscuta epithymum TaxID=186058 RepID=A0AAV0G6P5_9ASTE|nr:unnamed protein product [Cuscuta epithymum]CAH9143645.1 unnamed protein product [Cuscuta epithymum]
METQTTSPKRAPGLSAEVVGKAFVEQYYGILHHSPGQVYKFYQETSVLSRPDPNGSMTSVATMDSINEKICSFDYKSYKAVIKTVDAQDSYNGGVIVLVIGSLTGEDNLERKFTQTFFLAPQKVGYFVLNDILRYVETDVFSTTEGKDVEEDDNPEANAKMVGVDDAQTVVPSPDLEAVDEPECPNVYPATSHIEEVENVDIEVHSMLEDEKQVDIDREIQTEDDFHINENQISASPESTTSAALDDAKKMSYASVLSSQMKKGATKVYVPIRDPRVKTEKQSSSLVVSAPAPEQPPAPTAASGVIDESVDAQDGHSIHVRNLPFDITVDELEGEFKKYGPIKHEGVQVRSNRQQGFCFGFVEFEDMSSMNNAIEASPIMIGDRKVVIEVKRTTARGEGRGRFSSGRGYRNERFRDHGDFAGGRGYGRNDYGGREFSGRTRGGQGGGNEGRGGRWGRRGGLLSQNAAAASSAY